MYPRGSSEYWQEYYPAQSSYGQNPTSAYSGNYSLASDVGSQLNTAPRHPSVFGDPHEQEIDGYRSHPYTTQYGGRYNTLYGPSSLRSGREGSSLSTEGYGQPALEGHGDNGCNRTDSPKYASAEYASPSAHGYNYAVQKIADYSSLERRQYVERQSAYRGRDLPEGEGGRYADTVGYTHQHKSEMYNHLDQASLLRHDQMLKSQSLHSASHDGARQADYLTARDSVLHHPTQELVSFRGSVDINPGLALVENSPYRGQPAPSISVAAAQRDVDDLLYARHHHVRERKREQEWEREREQERKLLELREKECDRDRKRKRALESRLERTPPRAYTDRRGSSLTKDVIVKSLQRDSPHLEVIHRIHSPVNRRKYLCKVYSSRLVDAERDYLSLEKRYPRLYISPDFFKVIVNWPKQDLKLLVHTPVSFEHDFVEEESVADKKESSNKLLNVKPAISEDKSIVWNAKMILLSGFNKSAIEDLSSDKISDDRAPHICSILRFAVLKRDRSLMAIGGRWDAVDGGDPSVDDSSLVRTILRYSKDLINLDLQGCQHWNRFLEIHYDRVGEDGCFSHKEVTVFFVPDLSNCLPSINVWREQLMAYKKAVRERQRLLSLEKEKLRDKRVAREGISSSKDGKKAGKGEKPKEIPKKQDVMEKSDVFQKGKDGSSQNIKVLVKEAGKPTENVTNVEEKGKRADTSSPGTIKPTKTKIVKRIVKPKVDDKKVYGEKGPKGESDKNVADTTERAAQQDASSANPKTAKAITKKNVMKVDNAKKNIVKKIVKLEVDDKKVNGENETEGKLVKKVGDTTERAAQLDASSANLKTTRTFTKKKR